MTLDPMERATLYLYAVEGQTVRDIALRQDVSESTVHRTLKACCVKVDASNKAQAALRAYVNGDLTSANRSALRRAENGVGEERAIDVECRKQRKYHRWRGIGRDWKARES